MLLARQMGKTRIIAETGAGQHGVATATACALFGLPCEVYMGEEDVKRQAPNVGRMKLLGARVVPVAERLAHAQGRDERGAARLGHERPHDALLHRQRRGAAPVPGARRDAPERHRRGGARAGLAQQGALPDAAMACVGGGSNAIGLFRGFVSDAGVALVGVEAGGRRRRARGRHAATLGAGRVGVLHGSKSYVLCDDGGQITEAHSISAGLDYPGVGPEHAWLKDSGRATYVSRDGRGGARRRQAGRAQPRGSSPRSRRRTPSRASATWRGILRRSAGAR